MDEFGSAAFCQSLSYLFFNLIQNRQGITGSNRRTAYVHFAPLLCELFMSIEDYYAKEEVKENMGLIILLQMLFAPDVFTSSLAFTALGKIILKDPSRGICLPSLLLLIRKLISLEEVPGVGMPFVSIIFQAENLNPNFLQRAIDSVKLDIWKGDGEPFEKSSLKQYVMF